MGVYLVYFEERVIYVGSTNNFNVRFGIDLRHISTHTLYKKRFREYLKNEELFGKIRKIKKTKTEIIKENLTEKEFQQFNEAKEKTKSFFENKCQYKIKECKGIIEAECLEHFAIWHFEPEYNKGFYKKPVQKLSVENSS